MIIEIALGIVLAVIILIALAVFIFFALPSLAAFADKAAGKAILFGFGIRILLSVTVLTKGTVIADYAFWAMFMLIYYGVASVVVYIGSFFIFEVFDKKFPNFGIFLTKAPPYNRASTIPIRLFVMGLCTIGMFVLFGSILVGFFYIDKVFGISRCLLKTQL
ncbi:MAG: hypothetical protein PF482_04185 [Desulfobacteraceae bacterium]|jgi:hypothetical protein|nr:hypothetical protein [Desulfobacteraceae bacterium]